MSKTFKDFPTSGLPATDSDLSRLIGREIKLMADGQSEVAFDIGEEFTNFQGVLHGGA